MAKVSFWERTSLNAITNIIRTLIMAIIGIYLIPFYLDELGIAAYGVIPLATTLSSYIMIISDSLTSACTRYTTLAIRHSTDDACKALSTAVFGIVRVCLVMVPLVLVVAYFSPGLFDVSESATHDVRWMFALIFMSSLIVSVGSGFNSIFFAYNNLYLMYIARLTYSISQIGLIVILFWASTPSLFEVGVGYFISSLILLTCLIVFSKYTAPHIKARPSNFDGKLFKKMGQVGFWSILSKIGGLLYIEVSLIMVNLYLGAEVEAGFAIISTVISMLSTACLSLSVVLEPIYYRYYEEGNEVELRHTLYVGMKVIVMIMALPVAFLIVYSDAFFTAWVGSQYTYLGDILLIAMLGDLAYLTTVMLNVIPVLYLKNQYSVIVVLAFGLANAVITSFVLQFTDLGVEGAMGAWSFATIGQSVGMILLVTYITHGSYRKFFTPLVMGYVSLVVCSLVYETFEKLFELPGSWFALIPWALASFGVYMLIVLKFFIRHDEKDMVIAMFPGKAKSILHRILY